MVQSVILDEKSKDVSFRGRQGGDHMQGRRLVVLAAPLVAVAAGATSFAYLMPDYAQRVAATANVAPSKDAYTLRTGDDLDPAALDGVGRTLRATSLRAALNDPRNPRGKWGGPCARAAGVPPGAKAFCFNTADTLSTEWFPQGITTVSESRPDEKWGLARPIVVSWHDEDNKEPNRSARVTFINTRTGTYRHVLLVWPYRDAQGKPTYEPLGSQTSSDMDVHAGGLAWYGNRLYVADTGSGLRVFDMRRIFDLRRSRNGSTARHDLIGLHGNTYHAYGYRYVMPQVLSYVPNKQSGEACTFHGTPDHSWLSISRDALVTGEWCRNDRGRVAQFPLGNSGDLRADTKGQAIPSSVVRLPASHIQGGATSNGTWWFTRNASAGRSTGELLQARWSNGFKHVQRRIISYGPEDLSCWRSQQRLWTVAEPLGRRAVYGVPQQHC
jgi:hypothetical protein